MIFITRWIWLLWNRLMYVKCHCAGTLKLGYFHPFGHSSHLKKKSASDNFLPIWWDFEPFQCKICKIFFFHQFQEIKTFQVKNSQQQLFHFMLKSVICISISYSIWYICYVWLCLTTTPLISSFSHYTVTGQWLCGECSLSTSGASRRLQNCVSVPPWFPLST